MRLGRVAEAGYKGQGFGFKCNGSCWRMLPEEQCSYPSGHHVENGLWGLRARTGGPVTCGHPGEDGCTHCQGCGRSGLTTMSEPSGKASWGKRERA